MGWVVGGCLVVRWGCGCSVGVWLCFLWVRYEGCLGRLLIGGRSISLCVRVVGVYLIYLVYRGTTKIVLLLGVFGFCNGVVFMLVTGLVFGGCFSCLVLFLLVVSRRSLLWSGVLTLGGSGVCEGFLLFRGLCNGGLIGCSGVIAMCKLWFIGVGSVGVWF